MLSALNTSLHHLKTLKTLSMNPKQDSASVFSPSPSMETLESSPPNHSAGSHYRPPVDGTGPASTIGTQPEMQSRALSRSCCAGLSELVFLVLVSRPSALVFLS